MGQDHGSDQDDTDQDYMSQDHFSCLEWDMFSLVRQSGITRVIFNKPRNTRLALAYQKIQDTKVMINWIALGSVEFTEQ